MATSDLNNMFTEWMPTGYADVTNPDSLQYFNPYGENPDGRYDELVNQRPELRGALDFVRSGQKPTSGWMERFFNEGGGGSSQQIQFDSGGRYVPGTFATHINDDSEFWLGANLAGMYLNPLGGKITGAEGGLGAGLGLTGNAARAVNVGLNSAAAGGVEGNGLQSGALGALGAYSPNFASGMGITNKDLQDAVNGGIVGGVTASANKGDVKTGAGMGAFGGLANYAGNSISGGAVDNPFGQNYSRVPGATQTSVANITGNDIGQNFAPWAGNSTYTPPPQDRQSIFESQGLNDFFGGLNNFLPKTSSGWGDAAQGLLGMYQGYKQRKNAQAALDALAGRRGAYEKNLRSQLTARDAASGRRSNYEGRETQLQASLAQLDAGNAPLINALNNQETNGLVGMFASGLRYGGKAGWFGDKYNPNVPQQPYQAPYMPSTFSLGGMNNFESSGNNPYSLADYANKKKLFGGS